FQSAVSASKSAFEAAMPLGRSWAPANEAIPNQLSRTAHVAILLIGWARVKIIVRDSCAGRKQGQHQTALGVAQERSFWSRRDAVGRDQERPGGNGIGRSAMVLAQLAPDPLLEPAAVGVDHQSVAIRDAGPERAAEGAAEQRVQVAVQESARRQTVARHDED